MFGESLGPGVLAAAGHAMSQADLVLVIGSSLVVEPAASLPLLALRRGGRVGILNLDPTPLDGLAFLVAREPADQLLPRALLSLGIAP